jgi:site-specific recombinase XerD
MSSAPERLAGLFLDMLAAERGAAGNTLQAYRRDLDDYLAFLNEAGTGLLDVDPAGVRAFVAGLADRGPRRRRRRGAYRRSASCTASSTSRAMR